MPVWKTVKGFVDCLYTSSTLAWVNARTGKKSHLWFPRAIEFCLFCLYFIQAAVSERLDKLCLIHSHRTNQTYDNTLMSRTWCKLIFKPSLFIINHHVFKTCFLWWPLSCLPYGSMKHYHAHNWIFNSKQAFSNIMKVFPIHL